LTDEQTAHLIATLSDRPLLEADAQRALLERAGGNPLYAEQYVRMLDERGSAEEVPETVQGIIAARLDSLAVEEKALLQHAAVVGKVFWLGALGATDQQLHALQQKEFVQRARRSSVEGETEYAFKHLLVRDVAYGQIPRAERARQHVEAAAWIESLGRPEDHAETVAHHYATAMQLALAAGEDTDELGPHARKAFSVAGDRAAMLHALPAAERYYADALALTADDDPERPGLLFRHGQMRWQRAEEGADELRAARDGFLAAGDHERAAEAALFLAQVAWRQGSGDAVRAHLDDASGLVADLPPSQIQAAVLCEASRYDMLAGRTDRAVDRGHEALLLADELGLVDIRARALINVGTAQMYVGGAEASDELMEGVELAEQLNLIPEVLRGKNNIEVRTSLEGDLVRARELSADVRELSQRYGYLNFLRFLDGAAGIAQPYLLGDWDLCLERANAFVHSVEEGAPHYHAANAYSRRALITLARGDEERALLDAGRAVDVARPVGDPQLLFTALLESVQMRVETGDEHTASLLFDEAVASVQELPQLGFAVLYAHEFAWFALLSSRDAEIARMFSRETMQSRWLEAGRAVLAGDLHATAEILAGGSPTFEAFFRLKSGTADDVRIARDFYRGVGATRYVREAESLLAASA
jgi:hypothetical protein